MATKKYPGKALASFFLVLFIMPLGHAAMILMEHLMAPGPLHVCAFLLGLAGLLITIAGVFVRGDLRQTLCGLFGGLLFWTGWVEFLFQYYADRYGMQPLVDPVKGNVTQPEYLIMPATFGMMMMVLLIYLFSIRSGCNFFNWCQRRLFGGRRDIIVVRPMTLHTSIVTFMELYMMLWVSYVLLMFCYDPVFLGDSHPITILVGVGCFIGACFMFARQLRIPSWGANLRMSIATVIVFWTPVEIMGRNNLFQEIWVAPLDHVTEMLLILSAFILLGIYMVYTSRRKKNVR